MTEEFCSKAESDDKETLFTDKSVGCSSGLSSVPYPNVSLDDMSPVGGSAVSSLSANPDTDDGCSPRRAKRKRVMNGKYAK